MSARREPAFYEVPWIRGLMKVCVVLLVIAALAEGYHIADVYARRTVKREFTGEVRGKEKIPLSAELKNKPAWLDKGILDQIFAETQTFAVRNQETYDRLENPLDQEILGELAANYTATDAEGVNHWALRENAWIKKITEVRRVIAKDRKSQTIEIYAEYRRPAAWVVAGDKCYLIDHELVRLPGDYSMADRKATAGLMAITGVDLPAGASGIPEPSATWKGDDLAAGMKLADLLRGQRFAAQVDAIDMANFQGRKDSNNAWIVLDTIWVATNGSPRVVRWGRPVGEEKFYEISAAAKLKTLNEIYLKFSRIDAGRDYVDIRTEQVLLPKLAAQVDDVSGVRVPHS